MSDSIKLLVFSAGVFISAYASSCFFALPVYLPAILTVFFAGFTLLLNYCLKKALNSENKHQFTNAFLGLTGLKMLCSCILLAVLLSTAKQDNLQIGLCILAYYMLYTIFEVVIWKRKLMG